MCKTPSLKRSDFVETLQDQAYRNLEHLFVPSLKRLKSIIAKVVIILIFHYYFECIDLNQILKWKVIIEKNLL